MRCRLVSKNTSCMSRPWLQRSGRFGTPHPVAVMAGRQAGWPTAHGWQSPYRRGLRPACRAGPYCRTKRRPGAGLDQGASQRWASCFWALLCGKLPDVEVKMSTSSLNTAATCRLSRPPGLPMSAELISKRIAINVVDKGLVDDRLLVCRSIPKKCQAGCGVIRPIPGLFVQQTTVQAQTFSDRQGEIPMVQ